MATNSSYVGWGKENKRGLEQNEMNEAVGTDIYLGHYLLYPFHHGELSGLCYLQKIDTDRINPSWSQKVRYCGTCGSQLDITLFNPILTTLSARPSWRIKTIRLQEEYSAYWMYFRLHFAAMDYARIRSDRKDSLTITNECF